MVSQSIITTMIFAVCISALAIAVPFLIVYFLSKKRETGMFASAGLGLLAYFWSQYLLPIPILFILTNIKGFMTVYGDEKYSIVYILITAFMLSVLAGLGRLWAVWLMNKRTPSVYRALSSSIGFAAFKALSVIASYMTYINYSKTLNSSGREGLIKALTSGKNTVNDEALDKMISQLSGANVSDIAIEGINVILFVFVEMVLMVLIYKGMVKKKMIPGALISAGLGFVFTFISMILGKYIEIGFNKIINNAFMFVCGIVGLWFVIREVKDYISQNRYGGLEKDVF